MSDHDPLEGFASGAGKHITGPGFDALARTSARRRRTGYVASACAVAAVTGAVGFGMQFVGSDQTGPAAPGPTAPAAPVTPPHSLGDESRSAKAIVEDTRADNYRLAVSPDDPDVKASAWEMCPTGAPPAHAESEPTPTCKHRVAAVALTDDDFATVRLMRVRWLSDVTWVSGDTFIVRQLDGQLVTVSASGTTTQPIEQSTAPTPLQAGDLLVGDYAGEPQPPYVALDPQTMTAHPIPMPSEDTELKLYLQGATALWGRVGSTTLVSSPDGGATWRLPNPLPTKGLWSPIDSGDPVTLALIELGEDGFSLPTPSFVRSRDGGSTWQAVSPVRLQGHGVAWAAVEPSGKLLAYLSDGQTVHATALAAGLYESDDSSWTRFHAVASSPPLHGASSSPNDGGRLFTTAADGHGGQSLFLRGAGYLGSEPAGNLVSTDEGRTWTPTRYR